jgi:hypothetical protein
LLGKQTPRKPKKDKSHNDTLSNKSRETAVKVLAPEGRDAAVGKKNASQTVDSAAPSVEPEVEPQATAAAPIAEEEVQIAEPADSLQPTSDESVDSLPRDIRTAGVVEQSAQAQMADEESADHVERVLPGAARPFRQKGHTKPSADHAEGVLPGVGQAFGNISAPVSVLEQRRARSRTRTANKTFYLLLAIGAGVLLLGIAIAAVLLSAH